MRSAEIFIAVNSKDRVSGTENKYTVTLPRLIRNVTMVELISAEIPNTLYPSQQKYLYFIVHVNENYTDTTIPTTDFGGLYYCQAVIPEGVYSHGDAAVSLTQTLGVVKVYPNNATIKLMNSDVLPDPATEPLVNQETDDIQIVPDSPDSADSINPQIVPGQDNNNFDEGEGILENDINSDYVNDPGARSPDRQSELSYIGDFPPVNPALSAETALLQKNVSILFDLHFGKFYARVNNNVFDNFKVELAQTTPDLGYNTHNITPVPDGTNAGYNRYYCNAVSQMYSTSHIWLTIDELHDMPYWNLVSTFTLPMNVFARIQMCTDILHWVFWSQGVEEFKRECANGLTTSLKQLTIGWLDSNGNPTDFHGTDHSLVFRVTQSPPD